MKEGHAASPTGLWPYPSPGVGNSDPFPYLLPLLQRNRKELETDEHMPKSLMARGLVKHLIGPLVLP